MFGLSSLRNFLSNSVSRNTRKVVDINPHFIPLNLQALNVSLGSIIQTPQVGVDDINLSKFRSKLLAYMKGKYRNYIIISGKTIISNGKSDVPLDVIISNFTPAIVYSGGKSDNDIVGVVYQNYTQASKDLLNDYLNTQALEFLNQALKTTGKKFDLGYILQNNEDRSPEERTVASGIKKLFGILNSFSQNTVTVDKVEMPADKSKVIQTKIIVESLLESYTRFKPVGPVVTASIHKNTAAFIKNIRADILIIQDEFENSKIANEITSSAGYQTVGKIISDTKLSSGSFIENIKNSILSRFLGKKDNSSKRETAAITPIDLRKTAKTNVTSSVGKRSNVVLPESEVSLNSLMGIINQDLAKEVRANMGTGEERTVLNYRSGRLAGSYKVTAVSRERSGALTAFYTYMKYPYITFGPGGAQQNPLSRDPRRLGDKSIRNLAQNKVTARLRTVLI